MTRLRQPFLFLFGAALAGFIAADLPTTPIGYVERDLVFWLAMFPFAMSVGLPVRIYWLFLGIIPMALALRYYSGPAAPVLEVAAAIFLGVSLVVLATRQIRRMRQQK